MNKDDVVKHLNKLVDEYTGDEDYKQTARSWANCWIKMSNSLQPEYYDMFIEVFDVLWSYMMPHAIPPTPLCGIFDGDIYFISNEHSMYHVTFDEQEYEISCIPILYFKNSSIKRAEYEDTGDIYYNITLNFDGETFEFNANIEEFAMARLIVAYLNNYGGIWSNR